MLSPYKPLPKNLNKPTRVRLSIVPKASPCNDNHPIVSAETGAALQKLTDKVGCSVSLRQASLAEILESPVLPLN